MTKEISHCNVCASEVQTAISLPELPLTGLYFPTRIHALESPKFDQGLCICTNCGHVQLKNVIDPSIVYDESYTHRTSDSPLSRKGNEFFFKYIQKNVSFEDHDCVLEAGCNDGYLLSKLSVHHPECQFYGFDPIWINKKPQREGYSIFGSFVEDLDENLPDIKPSLIISAHTFEHVTSLKKSLEVLIKKSSEAARFIIEMPSFNTLLRLARFDQVFHQHIQYITESSIQQICRELGCYLNNIRYNYSYWGGTVIFDFQRVNNHTNFKIKDNKVSISDIHNSWKIFQQNIEATVNAIPNKDDIAYLGAAQMLPILNWHLKDKISVNQIYDDNPLRIGRYLPNMPTDIISLSDLETSPESPKSFIIGAVDSSKSIISRAREKNLSNVFSLFQAII